MINLAWVKDHTNWESPPCVSFPSLPRYGIERRAPRDGELDAPPPITDEVMHAAREDVKRAIQQTIKERISVLADMRLSRYQQCLDDPAYLRQCVELWFGVPHPYAMWASPGIATLSKACSTMVIIRDEALRTDRIFAVIAPSQKGYVVKIGLGSMTKHAGQVCGLDEAIALAERAVVQSRLDSCLESLLAGWSPETEIAEHIKWGDYPYWPVYVRRAPACDAPSAYDLPTWAWVKRGEIQIVTPWTRDDETERARLLERQRRGDERRWASEREDSNE